MVEDSRLGRPGGSRVVVPRDGVQELGSDRRFQRCTALLDQAQAEVHVPEQAALLRLPKRGAALELTRSADVVEERGCDEQVGTQPRV